MLSMGVYDQDHLNEQDEQQHMQLLGIQSSVEEESDEDALVAEAPQFETLVNDDDKPGRAMSFTVNEEMVEVVPTDMVESVVSFMC